MEGWPDALKETSLWKIESRNYVQGFDSANLSTQYGVKDLNLKNSYAGEKPVSVKEHLQNWRDRCIEIAENLCPTFNVSKDFVPRSSTENGWTLHLYVCQEKLLGWIAFKQTDASHLHFELYNASTSLTPDSVLVMGQTSKRSRALAGYFGEGVKVEINRLMDEGSRVAYFTNNSVWNFCYNERQVLHARIEPCQTPPNVTRVQLTNVPLEAYQPAEFLFINPCNAVLSSQPNLSGNNNSSLSGLDILFDYANQGRVYVHGILVKSFPDMSFGLNYTGVCNMSALGIGRDRDNLNMWALTQLIPHVFAENAANLPAFYQLCKLFYIALPKIKREAYSFTVEGVKSSTNEKNLQVMADGLLQYFVKLNGPNSMPAELASNELVREAEQFEFKVVAVDEAVLPWLQASAHCPTLAYLWKQNEQNVLSLPEYVFGGVQPEYAVSAVLTLSGTELQFAEQMRYIVSQYFGDTRYGHMLRFKDFRHLPKQNHRRFIPIKVAPSPKVSYCVLDSTLLNAPLVHKAYKAKEPDFLCEGNCGCVTNIVIDDMLNALGPAEREKLDAKFRRKFLNNLPTNLACPPSTADSSDPEPEPQQIQDIRKAASGIVHGASGPGSATATATAAGVIQKVGAVEVTAPPKVEVDAEDRAAQRGALEDLVESAERAALECCGVCAPQPGGATLGSFGVSAQRSVEHVVRCVVREEQHYHRLGPTCKSGLTIFVERSESARLMQVLQTEQKRALLGLDYVVCLLAKLFGQPLHKLHILVEDSQTVAFNRAGELFFNLLAMQPIFDRGPRYALEFWFVTFCHELTHNTCAEHNAKFATVFGHVTRFHIGKFMESLLVIGGAADSWYSFASFCDSR